MATTESLKSAAAGSPASSLDLAAIAKDAGLAGLVTLGMSFPIIMLRAEQNISNQLVLQQRWSWGVIAALIVFAARFLLLLARGRPKAVSPGIPIPAPPKQSVAPSRAMVLFTRYVGSLGVVALFVFPIVVTWALGSSGALKWINNYGVQILIYVMLGWGLNIVVGLAGLLDLGYVAFYAVGAYSYALLSTTTFDFWLFGQEFVINGLSFWICLPLAGLLAACWGVLLGFPVLRLRGDYLAIVTLAFGEIIRIILINFTDLTNGYAGIAEIPRATLFGIPFSNTPNGFAAVFGIAYSPIQRTIFLFYLILLLALLTNFVTIRLRRMPMGRAWEALREDEIACRSLGINTVTTKLTAFSLGAMFAGFAGSFFAVRQGFVSPESFTFIESATILAIVVLGGMGSQIGVAFAAVLMIGGTEILRELDFLHYLANDVLIGVSVALVGVVVVIGGGWLRGFALGAAVLIIGLLSMRYVDFVRDYAATLPKFDDFDPAQYRMLIFGFGMVVMMIWRPRGIVQTREPSIFLKESRAVSGSLVGEGHG